MPLQPFNDLVSFEGPAFQALNTKMSLIALGDNAAMAAAVADVAQEYLAAAGGDVNAMQIAFFRVPPGGELTERLRRMTGFGGNINKLFLLDIPAGGVFYACDSADDDMFEAFGEVAVKAFMSGIADGTVDAQQIGADGAACAEDCAPGSFAPCCDPGMMPGVPACPQGHAPGTFAPCCPPGPGGAAMGDLRFEVGERVEYNAEGVWLHGTIVATNITGPEGRVFPYHVELARGGHAFVPVDDDRIFALVG